MRCQGTPAQDLGREQLRSEPRGKVRLLAGDLPLMVEAQAQAPQQEVVGRRRIPREAEQSLAVLDLLDPPAASVTFDPGLEQRTDLPERPRVLQLQTAVEVVLLSAGDQLLQP